jgi:hypothetical protein
MAITGAGREPRALGQQVPHFVDVDMAVPGQVGRALARSSRRIDIGGDRPGRLAGAQQAAGLGLADGDVAGRQIQQDLGPGHGLGGAGRGWRPDVLADLDPDGEGRLAPRTGEVSQQHVGSERHGLAGEGQRAADHARAWREPATLVELAIVGQEALGDHGPHPAALYRDRGVVEPARVAQRRADHEQRRQRLALLGQCADGGLDRVEQGVLLQQVVNRVAGQAQLRQHQHRDARLVRLTHQGQHALGVGGGIRQLDLGNGGGDPDEAVTIGREERRRTQETRPFEVMLKMSISPSPPIAPADVVA